MPVQHVDYTEVLKQLETKRQGRDLSWRQLAMEMDVPAGTFSRLRNGVGCSNDAFVSMMAWLGADKSIKPFLKGKPE
jgi:hypothetical protein